MNTHNFKTQKKKSGSHAFTLVEVMFVVTIFGIVGAGLTSLMIDVSRSMLWTVNKSKITNDVRLFTLEISNEAVNANYAYLYSSFNIGDCDDMSDRRDIAFSGDCLILVYTEFPEFDPENNSEPYYERIVVYYRSADTEGYSPVFRREANFPSGTFLTSAYGEDGFESFLAEQFGSFGDEEEVLQLSKGLTNNQLFRVIGDHTIVINGEIIHGKNIQQITNTFNLTISTRG